MCLFVDMLFHMQEDPAGEIVGWVLPDNPSALPKITIYGPDGFVAELEANVHRVDLRDRGQHDTGLVGFRINEKILPEFPRIGDRIQIRESESNVLIYRRFLPGNHIEQKLFHFELQAMPDLSTGQLIARRFSLHYNILQRYPQHTLFAIINNPRAKSIYLSGCASLHQYEHLLRERQYKIVTLVRNPYEEMAERLLLARYSLSPRAPAFIADHMYGLEPLKELVKNIKFDEIESIRAAFSSMAEQQREVLSNPLVKALACTVDERPKSRHIEIALAKLSRMDLVGLRSRFDEFKSILPEILGADIFGNHQLGEFSWVRRIADCLPDIKLAKNLIALDLDLYLFAEEAVTEAMTIPVPSA
jgi:hypothetical protein